MPAEFSEVRRISILGTWVNKVSRHAGVPGHFLATQSAVLIRQPLQHRGGEKRRAGAPGWASRSSDPMIEAGTTSTLRNVARLSYRDVVPAPPGIVMVAPPEVPRNVEGVAREGRAV
jgi:hypothetical protein